MRSNRSLYYTCPGLLYISAPSTHEAMHTNLMFHINLLAYANDSRDLLLRIWFVAMHRWVMSASLKAAVHASCIYYIIIGISGGPRNIYFPNRLTQSLQIPMKFKTLELRSLTLSIIFEEKRSLLGLSLHINFVLLGQTENYGYG